jgi:hypothetical protein
MEYWSTGVLEYCKKKERKNRHWFCILTLSWFCLVSLSSDLAAYNKVSPHILKLLSNKKTVVTGKHDFLVAQNNRNGETENEPAPKQGEKSDQAGEGEKQPGETSRQTDPVESFEPTEKVEADQAVDFPYDI